MGQCLPVFCRCGAWNLNATTAEPSVLPRVLTCSPSLPKRQSLQPAALRTTSVMPARPTKRLEMPRKIPVRYHGLTCNQNPEPARRTGILFQPAVCRSGEEGRGPPLFFTNSGGFLACAEGCPAHAFACGLWTRDSKSADSALPICKGLSVFALGGGEGS